MVKAKKITGRDRTVAGLATKRKKKQTSPVYHFSARWSTEHTTYNRKLLYKWLKSKADKFIFQAECTIVKSEGACEGEVLERPNPHYQIYFHTKAKHRPQSFYAELNAGEMKGMEVRVSSTAGLEALKTYCMKDETKVAGPWADHKIYIGQDLWPKHRMPMWQKQLVDYIDTNPGDRQMIWVYDRKGNNGKTKFVKYIGINYDTPALSYACSTDALNLCMKFPHKRVYMWNLTRAKPANLSEFDLYSAMESVKDGCWVNTKYETKCLYQLPAHIIVMANHPPKTCNISADRWSIVALRGGEMVDYDRREKQLIAEDIKKEEEERLRKEAEHDAMIARGEEPPRRTISEILGIPPRAHYLSASSSNSSNIL